METQYRRVWVRIEWESIEVEPIGSAGDTSI